MTLSIADLVDESVKYGWRERRMLAKHGAVPFFVIAFVTMIAPAYMAPNAPPSQRAIGIALIVAQLLVCVPMVVTWYRMVVLGKEEGARQPIFVFGRREWRLLGWQAGVMLAGIAGLGLIGGLLVALYTAMGEGVVAIVLCGAVGLAAFCAAFVAITRVSFVFAMAATDQPASFKLAWAMSRNVTWPLLWSLMVISLGQAVVTFVGDLIGGIFSAAVHGAATVFAFTAMATLFGQVLLYVQRTPSAAPAAETAPLA